MAPSDSGFLPKRCHSTSAIENQRENASLQEVTIRCSLRLELSHGGHRAEADDDALAQGGGKTVGRVEEKKTIKLLEKACHLLAVSVWPRSEGRKTGGRMERGDVDRSLERR